MGGVPGVEPPRLGFEPRYPKETGFPGYSQGFHLFFLIED